MDISRDEDVRKAHARDASGIELIPEGVARATSAADVVECVRTAAELHTCITPAGSQTSMTGASITDQGIILSLSPMNRIVDVDAERGIAKVESGVRIGDLNRHLSEAGLLFAPDPTSENDATIGGAIACNASGARSLFYGPTRSHVDSVTVVHADGSTARYERRTFEKNTVGFSAAQNAVDWFVGSEGTLGVVVEAELSLVPRPHEIVGLSIPFPTQEAALEFVTDARDGNSGRVARCLEFFDDTAMAIAAIATGSPWAADAAALVYLEDDVGAEGNSDSVFTSWLALGERHGAIDADIRVHQGEQALRDARVMRHAVPATMNERGAKYHSQGGRKVSTDWAVPYHRLAEALAMSKDAVERNGAPAPVTYGHAGNGHPHQNFIAEHPEALRRIGLAIEETLHGVVAMGGTVSAEHGLGKIKRPWLSLQLEPRQIAVMRAMKHALDPAGMFSPGNVL